MSNDKIIYQYRRGESNKDAVNFGEWSEWQDCNKNKYWEVCEYIMMGYCYEARESELVEWNYFGKCK